MASRTLWRRGISLSVRLSLRSIRRSRNSGHSTTKIAFENQHLSEVLWSVSHLIISCDKANQILQKGFGRERRQCLLAIVSNSRLLLIFRVRILPSVLFTLRPVKGVMFINQMATKIIIASLLPIPCMAATLYETTTEDIENNPYLHQLQNFISSSTSFPFLISLVLTTLKRFAMSCAVLEFAVLVVF
jgi:hypothetical protein